MNEVIKLLKQMENKEIPVISTVSQDFISMMEYAKEKPMNKETVREYLRDNDMYSGEESVDHVMKNLFTVYASPQNEDDKRKLTSMIKTTIKVGGEIVPNRELIKELIDSGFKCYPVLYHKQGFVLGIITKVGHVIVE